MGDSKQKPIPKPITFAIGGLSGIMGSCVVHPLDVLKNRMQVSTTKEHKTSFHLGAAIVKSEGIGSLYKGLSASILRQATYTTTRLGIFNWLFELSKGPNGEPPNFAAKAGIGMIAGACGAFVGNPTEVCLIRMTADGRLPPNERRNYTHVGNALARIVKEEGLLTLWSGGIPTVVRAVVVNATQLGTYAQAKQQILETKVFKEGLMVHFLASMLSGFATAVASLPIDILKTRIQNMRVINGVPEYKGSLDALTKITQKEGVLALWKGFTPYYSRLGPHTVLTFIFMEQLTNLYRSY